MKLAVLGAITLVLGAVLGAAGLMIAGGFWVVAGLGVYLYKRRLEQDRAERGAALQVAGQKPKPVYDKRTAVITGLILFDIGAISLVIGIVGIGFDSGQDAWRWLPIGVGGLLAGLAVVGALMYALGAGLTATADSIGVPDRAATLTIRSVRETGTFVNERPRLEFVFLVQPEGLASYEVTKKATVPYTAMGSIAVGDGFRAKVVGPDKPTAMEIDWDAPIHGSAEDVPVRLKRLEKLRGDGLISAEEYDVQRTRILNSL